MQNQDKIFEQLRTLFESQPESFNVIEEQIDIDLQLNYFKRSKKLRKQNLSVEEVLEKATVLDDAESRLEEKRDILMLLASFDSVETFRKVEAFWKNAQADIKPWASMAYRESKMAVESSLLDEKQILISTGLGGKGYKLRFFIVLVHKENETYSDSQKKLIETEVEFAVNKSEGVFESISFEDEFAKILSLIPLNINVKTTVNAAIEECNQYGDFISENFLITNVKELDNEEIKQVMTQRNEEDFDETDFEELEGFDDFDDE